MTQSRREFARALACTGLLVAAADFAEGQTEPGSRRCSTERTWTAGSSSGGVGPGYVVEGDRMVCPPDGGGNFFTEKEYANFVLRLEFK